MFENQQLPQLAQHNNLVRANLHFSTMEARIFTLMLKGIKKEDTKTRAIEVHVSEIVGYNPSGKAYKLLKEACKELWKKDIDILKVGKKHSSKPNKNDFHKVRLVQELELDTGTGFVKGKFSDRVQEYVIQLKKEYTLAEFEHLMTLKSGYSHRMYWLMKSYESVGGKTLMVEELKRMVGAIEMRENEKTKELEEKDKYSRYYDFKKRVLVPAMNDVKQLMTVDFKENKNGRVVESITFTIPKTILNIDSPTTAPTSSQIKGLTEDQERIFNVMVKHDLTESQASFFIRRIDHKIIAKKCYEINVKYINNQVTNKPAAIVDSLQKLIKKA